MPRLRWRGDPAPAAWPSPSAARAGYAPPPANPGGTRTPRQPGPDDTRPGAIWRPAPAVTPATPPTFAGLDRVGRQDNSKLRLLARKCGSQACTENKSRRYGQRVPPFEPANGGTLCLLTALLTPDGDRKTTREGCVLAIRTRAEVARSLGENCQWPKGATQAAPNGWKGSTVDKPERPLVCPSAYENGRLPDLNSHHRQRSGAVSVHPRDRIACQRSKGATQGRQEGWHPLTVYEREDLRLTRKSWIRLAARVDLPACPWQAILTAGHIPRRLGKQVSAGKTSDRYVLRSNNRYDEDRCSTDHRLRHQQAPGLSGIPAALA